jgi:hypothetical protein
MLLLLLLPLLVGEQKLWEERGKGILEWAGIRYHLISHSFVSCFAVRPCKTVVGQGGRTFIVRVMLITDSRGPLSVSHRWY